MENPARMIEANKDKVLLAELKHGDREAFEALYDRHQRRVFSIAVNFFGGDSERASDVLQQVFLKLFRGSVEFRGDAEFSTWLYRVTVNACIDERRKLSRFFGLGEYFGLTDKRTRQDDRFQQRQVSEQVQRAIATLKPKYRLPVVLKYTEGLSYQQIADVLEISIGTVSSRMNRGHALLAKKLGHLRSDPDRY